MSRLSCATPKYRFATSCEVTEKEKKNNLTLTSDPKTIHDSEKSGKPYTKLNQFFEGQGVGLTVARNLARRLGGNLVLDTEHTGTGSRFVLSLPM